jgi:ABC-type antimicrobial peptide transport system permease subunit
VLARIAGRYVQDVRLPEAGTVAAAAAVLVAAAVIASLMPAARAARVDALTALRAD